MVVGLGMECAVTHEPHIHLSNTNYPTWIAHSAAVVIFLFDPTGSIVPDETEAIFVRIALTASVWF